MSRVYQHIRGHWQFPTHPPSQFNIAYLKHVLFRTQFEIFEIIIGASESIENRVSTKEDEKFWSDAIL